MTISVTITNTSNAEGEYLVLELKDKMDVRLSPGESVRLGVQEVLTAFEGLKFDIAAARKPYTMNGRQVYPAVTVGWEPFNKTTRERRGP